MTHLEELFSITSQMNDTNERINRNIKLLDIKDVTESFIKMQEQLSEVAVKSTTSSLIQKAKSISFLGKAIKKAEETAFSMQTVHSTLASLFEKVEQKYNKLVEVGTDIQKGKVKLEEQIKQLESLEVKIDNEIASFINKEDIPLYLLSAQTQTGTYINKYKARLMNVNASIFAAQETIKQLGAYLPTFKSELNDSLALASLLNEVSDYQTMYQALSKLIKEISDINDTRTQSTITQLLDLQINDTTTRDVLTNMTTRADKFSIEILNKAEKLHNKIVDDHKFYAEVKEKGLITTGINKISALLK